MKPAAETNHGFFTSGPGDPNVLSFQSRCNLSARRKRNNSRWIVSPIWEATELLDFVYKHVTRKKCQMLKKKKESFISYKYQWNTVNREEIHSSWGNNKMGDYR